MTTITVDKLKSARYQAFRWRCELSITQKLALALGVAVLTGLLAQLRAPLPWTPVPITGQTAAVLLAGVLLGKWWGGISQVIYVGLGIAGVPWFTNWGSGISYLAGPTGGYLIGFVFAALLIGYFTEKYTSARQLRSLLGLMLIGNFILVYIPGVIQLGLWLNLVNGQSIDVSQVLSMGFTPFIIGDIIKVLLVAGIAWGVTPKESFDKKD